MMIDSKALRQKFVARLESQAAAYLEYGMTSAAHQLSHAAVEIFDSVMDDILFDQKLANSTRAFKARLTASRKKMEREDRAIHRRYMAICRKSGLAAGIKYLESLPKAKFS